MPVPSQLNSFLFIQHIHRNSFRFQTRFSGIFNGHGRLPAAGRGFGGRIESSRKRKEQDVVACLFKFSDSIHSLFNLTNIHFNAADQTFLTHTHTRKVNLLQNQRHQSVLRTSLLHSTHTVLRAGPCQQHRLRFCTRPAQSSGWWNNTENDSTVIPL